MQTGSIKKALNIKGKEDEYTKISKVFENIENVDIIDLIASKEEIFANKEETNDILSYINLIFFEKINTNAKYIECMNIIEDTKDRLNKNNNFDMAIDNFLITVWEEINGNNNRS